MLTFLSGDRGLGEIGRVEAFTMRLGGDLASALPLPVPLERRSTPESSQPREAPSRLPLASIRLCLALGMGGRESEGAASPELMASVLSAKN